MNKLKRLYILCILLGLTLGASFFAGRVQKSVSRNHKSDSESFGNVASEPSSPKQANPKNIFFYTDIGSSQSIKNDELDSISIASKKFTIELSTVSNRHEAESLIGELRRKGILAYYTPIRRGPDVRFKIRIGVFSTPNDAEKKLQNMARGLPLKAKIIKL